MGLKIPIDVVVTKIFKRFLYYVQVDENTFSLVFQILCKFFVLIIVVKIILALYWLNVFT